MIKSAISNSQCTAFPIQSPGDIVFSLTANGVEKEVLIGQSLIPDYISFEITDNMIIVECSRPHECISIDVHDADFTLMLKGSITGLLCRSCMDNRQGDDT